MALHARLSLPGISLLTFDEFDTVFTDIQCRRLMAAGMHSEKVSHGWHRVVIGLCLLYFRNRGGHSAHYLVAFVVVELQCKLPRVIQSRALQKLAGKQPNLRFLCSNLKDFEVRLQLLRCNRQTEAKRFLCLLETSSPQVIVVFADSSFTKLTL